MARRQAMLDLGGFNEALYPNEENALMDEMQKDGGKLIYDPQFTVHRRPRPTLKAFAKMLRTYGRGRAEQFRLHPTPGSAMNFVPPLFCVYLLILAPLAMWVGKVAFLPLAFYFIALLAQAAALLPTAGLVRTAGAIPLIVLTHLLYGIGFWRGLITKLNTDRRTPATKVVLEKIVR
jgi:hypothetical protein